MLFNTLSFGIFLPIVFFFYWFGVGKKIRNQNALLLFSSYVFYSAWDWRFLFLLLFSTLLDFFSGLKMASGTAQNRKMWFWISIVANIGFLATFKYFNFFAQSFADMLRAFGLHPDMPTLNVILPVGISFYTFHGLSYVIDVYKNRIQAEKVFVDYALFVSFFPLLVAGPIERATHLLPQIKRERLFNYTKAAHGLRQILWGLFKKIAIADQCAPFVNRIFEDPSSQSGSMLAMAAVLFAFQIYCDFSGYSDIALGTAQLFGINLLRNFSYPYFSRDAAEFWRRWHISLSSWFRDYLYIPLGGSKGSTFKKVRNVLIIFLVSGFWHGANWTFIAWGLLNALYVIPSVITRTNRNNLEIVAQDKILPSLKDLFAITITFIFTVFAWIFFRSENLAAAFNYIGLIFRSSLFSVPTTRPITLILLISLLITVEWIGRREDFALAKFGLSWPRFVRWGFYYAIMILIAVSTGGEKEFIYFQF